MVHVTNRAHVHVRLGPLEFAFAIFSLLEITRFSNFGAHGADRTRDLSLTKGSALPLSHMGRPINRSSTQAWQRIDSGKPSLWRRGAGDGNRTRVISLEGWVLPLNYSRSGLDSLAPEGRQPLYVQETKSLVEEAGFEPA